MSSFFTTIIVRLFAGGLICSVALMLTGDGAKKEIVRLCCACLMIVLVLTPVKGADLDLEAIFSTDEDVEQYIERIMQDSEQQKNESIKAQLAEYIKGRAAELGITCEVSLLCATDEDGVYVVEAVHITYSDGEAALSELKRTIASECGVDGEKITFAKEQLEG